MTDYELRFPWPWHLPEGITRALVIGVIAAAVAVVGIIAWNSSQALTGIHQLQASNAQNARNQADDNTRKLLAQITQAQGRIDSLNAQIGVLQGQATVNGNSISLLVADVDNLARALQTDINQLIALGQRPAAAQPARSTSATTTTTTVPARAGSPPTTTTVTVPRPGCGIQILGQCLGGTTPTTKAAVATGNGFGCAPALAYLHAHQAPGFTDVCAPHSAFGHYGVTCVNHLPQCAPGTKVIYIACPADFVYRNEAENSWVLTGGPGRIDAYGQGTPAEQATCNRYA